MKFLLSRWVLSGIAVAALCALIWFFTPLIGSGVYFPMEPVLPRAVLIGVIVLFWFSLNFRRSMKARARERRLIEGMAKPDAVAADPDATATAEEVAILGDG